MGLNAIVYRNLRSLRLECDRDRAYADPITGEVVFDDDNLAKKYSRNDFEAVAFRLGNISEIASLRDEIGGLLDDGSVLLQRVLYSGTHTADVIPLELMARLSAEVEIIAKSPRLSDELRAFVSKIKTLAGAAMNESNPIVFV